MLVQKKPRQKRRQKDTKKSMKTDKEKKLPLLQDIFFFECVHIFFYRHLEIKTKKEGIDGE